MHKEVHHMETVSAITRRRSIRKYTNQPVSDTDLKDILEAAVMAPSASNLQPWYFIVIRSPEKMEALKKLMAEATKNLMPYWHRRFAKYPRVITETADFVRFLGDAPVCILAFLLRTEYEMPIPAIQSVAAAIENMLLTATDKGLGSCWLTAPLAGGVGQEVHDMFAPDKGELVAMITLGYAAQSPSMPRRKDGRYTII